MTCCIKCQVGPQLEMTSPSRAAPHPAVTGKEYQGKTRTRRALLKVRQRIEKSNPVKAEATGGLAIAGIDLEAVDVEQLGHMCCVTRRIAQGFQTHGG